MPQFAKEAEVNAKNNDGETPLYWAKKNDHKDLAKLLRQNGGQDITISAEANNVYQPVDFSDLSLGLKGHSWVFELSHEANTASEATEGTVDQLLCEGRQVELVSNKIEGGYVVTKDFGKVKIKMFPPPNQRLQVWLTAKAGNGVGPS